MARCPQRSGTHMPFWKGHHLRLWEADSASHKYRLRGISLRRGDRSAFVLLGWRRAVVSSTPWQFSCGWLKWKVAAILFGENRCLIHTSDWLYPKNHHGETCWLSGNPPGLELITQALLEYLKQRFTFLSGKLFNWWQLH